MRPLKGDRNQCSGCKEYFNSTGAFEGHRTGKHGVDRRCRTVDEMIERGYSKNKLGFWIASKMPTSLIEQITGETNADTATKTESTSNLQQPSCA